MRPPYRRLSADDRLPGEEDRARRQRLHAGRVSSIVAALGLTRFLPFIHGAAPADVAAPPQGSAEPAVMGADGHPADRSRSKTAAAISFVMVVTLGTTAASLPPASTPNSSTTPAAAVTTTTTTPAAAVTTTTTPLRPRPRRRRLPLRSRPRRRRLPLPTPTTTSPSAGTTTTTAAPVDTAPTTAAAAAAPLADDPTISRAHRRRARRQRPPRSGHSPMGRCTPPRQWATPAASATCTTSGGTCTIAVPAGRQWDVTQTTPPPGYYLNPSFDSGTGDLVSSSPYTFRTGTLNGTTTDRRARDRPERPVHHRSTARPSAA